MKKMEVNPVIRRVFAERGQDHETRASLFVELEKKLDRPVITFFTSFVYPVMMEDSDVDMVAGLLQMMDLSRGLVLIISSPGGDGLSAERMINAYRSLSGTGEYWAIVPGKAKSAATMVCFGASKIYMGQTSELGPVDPQVTILENNIPKRIPAFHIVESYKSLFRGATRAKGNLEPYLLQLAKYNPSVIKNYEALIDLSKDISIGALKSGMMGHLTPSKIEQRIKVFLTPEGTKAHGRAIFPDNALQCGLNIEKIESNSDVWQLIYELYMRTNNFVSREAAKCIESKDQSFVAAPPRSN